MCSAHLRNFKWHGAQGRSSCPVCGDSTKKKSKARLYFLPKGQSYVVYCHNCHISWPLANLLKTINPSLHEEYVKETALENLSNQAAPRPKKYDVPKQPWVVIGEDYLSELKKVSSLDVDHPAHKYVVERMIPVNQHFRIYYHPSFMQWCNKIVPGKYEKAPDKDPRLVLPFLDRKKRMFGVNARALNEKSIRYLSVMFDPDMPKVFGFEQCDMNKKFYIFEGPIDSLFIHNSIAMGGSSINEKNILDMSNGIYVFDNQPRNKELISLMEKTIDQGSQICIWPQTIKEKDINDMVLAGRTRIDIRQQIDTNTFSGLSAKIKLTEWRKI